MFADTAAKGAKFLLALKRGRFGEIPGILGVSRSGYKTSRTVADAWLQYQYGWKPLTGDIHDTCLAALQAADVDQLLTGVGKSFYEAGNDFVYGDEQWGEHTEGRVRTELKARLKHPNAYILNSLGLVNPAAIAWELTPWSFAVDWFVPVGAVLEAMQATLGLTFERGWQTRQHRYVLHSQKILGRQNEFYVIDEAGEYQEAGFDMEREPYGSFPIPQFYADITPFSTSRVLNAAALVRQLFR